MIALPIEMDYRYGIEKRIIRKPRGKRGGILLAESEPQANMREGTACEMLAHKHEHIEHMEEIGA